MSEEAGPARTPLARAGIAALNLLAPGLGLLRLERPRAAAFFYFVPLAGFILIFVLWAATGPLPFWALMLSAAALALLFGGALLGSIRSSWRHSAGPAPASRPAWARWYAIAAAWLISFFVAQWLPDWGHHYYRPFYMPADGMAPTLVANDRMVASMRVPAPLRRGDVVLLRTRDGVYVKRLAGLPGDVIGLVGGRVLLNGREVPQHLVRSESYRTYIGDMPVRRLREQFPGEAAPHEIYDERETAQDDVPPTAVPPGHVFVLGDNRDMSADSRFGPLEGGVGQVRVEDVIGIGLYYTYGPSGRSGERIGPAR